MSIPKMRKRTDLFDASSFEVLKKAEDTYFWFCVRRKWIFASIAKYKAPPANVLEIGCGTGNVSSFLARQGYAVTGCEYHNEALDIAWPGFTKVCADGAQVPFDDSSFDVVGLFDVIEHTPDDLQMVNEAARLLKKGGIIIVTVPAREELWSWLDEVSYHKRRYSKEMLNTLFSEALLDVVCLEYMFMSLYLPMKLARKHHKDPSDTFKINTIANMVMRGVTETERMISRIIPLPIGTSLLAVAKKRS